MLRLAVFLVAFAAPAFADTVRVASGEHADFSRLVLSLPEEAAWQFGRTANGYALSVGENPVRFDVSRVFDLIPRTRLAGIFADPQSGYLNLTVGCECHAIPFALDARTIVIDLRDGEPPPTSAFETGLDGQTFPPLQPSQAAKVRPRPRLVPQTVPPALDWTRMETPAPQSSMFPWIETSGDADQIREALVEQLADGAARSVIQLSIPQEPTEETVMVNLPEDVPIRVSNEIGLQVFADRTEQRTLQPDGEACLPDAELSLEQWGSPELMASGIYLHLVGEFDAPQPPQISSAIKRLLYLGFGAEARALLRAYPLPPEESALLGDLALILDGEAVKSGNSFEGMESCDTAAALWAFLANNPPDLANPNLPAIKRTFSALPSHLRTHLGDTLVERLVARNEVGTAVEVSEAMQRGVATDEASIALATADVLLSTGAASKAVEGLEDLATKPGVHQARAIAALVVAKVAAEEPVTIEEAASLGAFVDEYAGDPIHAELVRAHGLALASSGQFEDVLDLGMQGSPLDPLVWELLAKNSTDDQLLSLAIQPPDEKVTSVAAELIADRLASLGFMEEAELWRVTHDVSQILDAGAWQSEAVIDGEDAPAEVREDRWQQDWQSVAANEDGIWAEIAKEIDPSAGADTQATLAGASAALTQSQETRALVSELFREVSGSAESQ